MKQYQYVILTLLCIIAVPAALVWHSWQLSREYGRMYPAMQIIDGMIGDYLIKNKELPVSFSSVNIVNPYIQEYPGNGRLKKGIFYVRLSQELWDKARKGEYESYVYYRPLFCEKDRFKNITENLQSTTKSWIEHYDKSNTEERESVGNDH